MTLQRTRTPRISNITSRHRSRHDTPEDIVLTPRQPEITTTSGCFVPQYAQLAGYKPHAPTNQLTTKTTAMEEDEQEETTIKPKLPRQCHSITSDSSFSSVELDIENLLANQRHISKVHIVDAYGDAGIYTGDAFGQIPNGKGRMDYEDGREYVGNWYNNHWHGPGRATFINGDVYTGNYSFGQRHGTGTYIWSDGRWYTGEFCANRRQGKGIFTWTDGAKYDGSFCNGQQDGHGSYTYPDGSLFTGFWKQGHYHGQGDQ